MRVKMLKKTKMLLVTVAVSYGAAALAQVTLDPRPFTVDMRPYNREVGTAGAALGRGDFEVAIPHLRSAMALDPMARQKCGGAWLRSQIRAANDGLVMMRQKKLSRRAAPAWFDKRSAALWKKDRCYVAN